MNDLTVRSQNLYENILSNIEKNPRKGMEEFFQKIREEPVPKGINGRVFKVLVQKEVGNPLLQEFIRSCNKAVLISEILFYDPPAAEKLLEIAPEFYSFYTLAEAARLGRVEIIKALLEKEPDLIKERTKISGKHAFHFAAEAGSLDVLKYFHLHCKEINLLTRASDGSTALHLAAANNFLETVEFLVRILPDEAHYILDNSGRTPLQAAINKAHINIAVILEPYNLLYKIERDFLKGLQDFFQKFPEADSVPKGVCGLVFSLLVKKGVDSSYLQAFIDNYKKNLMFETLYFDPSAAEKLLEEAPELYSFSTLVNASRIGTIGIIKILLEKKPELIREKGKVSEMQAFHFAAESGSLEVLKYFYENYKEIDFLSKNRNGSTALHLAAANNFPETVQFLASILPEEAHYIQDSRGRTPLHAAIYRLHENIACILEPFYRRWDIVDDDSRTVLFIARENHTPRMVKFYRQVFKDSPSFAEAFMKSSPYQPLPADTDYPNRLILLYILQEMAPPPWRFSQTEYDACLKELSEKYGPEARKFVTEKLCRVSMGHINRKILYKKDGSPKDFENALFYMLQECRIDIIDKIVQSVDFYNSFYNSLCYDYNLAEVKETEIILWPPEKETLFIADKFRSFYSASNLVEYFAYRFMNLKEKGKSALNSCLIENFPDEDPSSHFHQCGVIKWKPLKEVLVKVGILENRSPFKIIEGPPVKRRRTS